MRRLCVPSHLDGTAFTLHRTCKPLVASASLSSLSSASLISLSSASFASTSHCLPSYSESTLILRLHLDLRRVSWPCAHPPPPPPPFAMLPRQFVLFWIEACAFTLLQRVVLKMLLLMEVWGQNGPTPPHLAKAGLQIVRMRLQTSNSESVDYVAQMRYRRAKSTGGRDSSVLGSLRTGVAQYWGSSVLG